MTSPDETKLSPEPGRLPRFVAPMLATPGPLVCSEAFRYEIKWDGVRAIAGRDGGVTRVSSRNGTDLARRCGELIDAPIPDGVILDGELVSLRDGHPDFADSLSGETAKSYVVFDLLYIDYESVMDEPLEARRERLESLRLGELEPSVVLSPWYSDGEALYREVCRREMEGVIAKRIDGRYLPGKRSDLWVKVKREQTLFCVIVGYLITGNDLKSLLVATNEADGTLAYVGRVGSGFGEEARRSLAARLARIRRETPVVPVDEEAFWVEPELFCRVRFTERTRAGFLRSPVFAGMVER